MKNSQKVSTVNIANILPKYFTCICSSKLIKLLALSIYTFFFVVTDFEKYLHFKQLQIRIWHFDTYKLMKSTVQYKAQKSFIVEAYNQDGNDEWNEWYEWKRGW